MPLRSLTPQQVVNLQQSSAVTLLDVREPWEYERVHLQGSVHIPMDDIHGRLGELDPKRSYVVVCHHGNRSRQVATFLAARGFADVINLEGGIEEWAVSVAPDLPRY